MTTIYDKYQKDKERLKNDFQYAIKKFEESTGCVITDINIDFLTYGFMHKIDRSDISCFKVKTNL